MHVMTPRGTVTSTPLRLLALAPLTVTAPRAARRAAGTGIDLRPSRYSAVMERRLPRTPASGPSATTSPPWSPAPGPRSMMWSDARMVSSSCSTTRTVLPRSLRRLRVPMSRRLSRWWSPMLGSSST